MNKHKSGFLTSEFWLAIVAVVFPYMGVDPGQVSDVVTNGSTFVAGAYALGRSLYKAFGGGK